MTHALITLLRCCIYILMMTHLAGHLEVLKLLQLLHNRIPGALQGAGGTITCYSSEESKKNRRGMKLNAQNSEMIESCLTDVFVERCHLDIRRLQGLIKRCRFIILL